MPFHWSFAALLPSPTGNSLRPVTPHYAVQSASVLLLGRIPTIYVQKMCEVVEKARAHEKCVSLSVHIHGIACGMPMLSTPRSYL